MIDISLGYIRQALDQYLVTSFDLESGFVVLNNLVNADGSTPLKNQNKIVITLVNLEYETNKQFYGGQKRYGDQVNQINPAVCFNLDVLISASFDDYGEALKFLTAIIGFFQENLSFTRANNPTLPEEITTLKFEIENSPTSKTHNLWSALGAKYMPSIIYKIRHVSVESGQIKSSSGVIKEIPTVVTP